MSNVFQLSKLKKIGDHSSDDPNANVTIAVAEILASCVQLGRTVKELSKHFGAVDHLLDILDKSPEDAAILRRWAAP